MAFSRSSPAFEELGCIITEAASCLFLMLLCTFMVLKAEFLKLPIDLSPD